METNLKFKVGDKVKVKSLEWYNDNNVNGVVSCNGFYDFPVGFVKGMSHFCGEVLEITEICGNHYRVEENNFAWVDSMFEDEQEKQEVEQTNKNNMEKTKMTLKEAQEIVKNTKYIVWSEDESRVLQEKLFEIGCKWKNSGITICHTDSPFLFVDDNLGISFATKQNYKELERSNKYYMHTDCIVGIEIEKPKEEPEPKFDPSTLQPFDKVLVRDDEEDKWKCSFFSHICNGTSCVYVCTAHDWEKCIPYNDETKHLLGTADEAPEFYKL